MYSGFSERTFEFCFNAEYCRLNAGILATHPNIPSQNEEKDLGYDVELRLLELGAVRSLFLQHKIVHFAEKRAGRNARFFNAHGGPYYRFPVDSEQHNVLVDLANNRGNAFYCAPMFNRSIDLRGAYENDQVCQRSLWLDPTEVGEIHENDNEKHHITFSPDGALRIMHSETRFFKETETRSRGREALRPVEITEGYLDSFAASLIQAARKSERSSAVSEAIERDTATKTVQHILAKVYDVSWIILPDE